MPQNVLGSAIRVWLECAGIVKNRWRIFLTDSCLKIKYHLSLRSLCAVCIKGFTKKIV